MTTPARCPPEHQPITDDDIAWAVVTLHRTGMGNVEARALHLRDEGEAHEVATLLASYGPTWMLDLLELRSSRYGGEA